MTNTSLPPHLERIGRQLTAAAHDLASPPRRRRRRALGLAAASTTGLAAIATAAVLTVGATTGTPPAFAVTRHHDGTVSLTINRTSSIAAVNRTLREMGISKIDERTMAPHGDMSTLPACSAIPPGWKGMWVQPAADVPPGTTVYTDITPGTWLFIYCLAINPGHSGSDTIDNTGSGTGTTAVNTSTTGAG
jgi:hypothetical protein